MQPDLNTDTPDFTPASPPPKQPLHWQRALLWHALGFITLLVLTWFDALFDLMHHLLGQPARTQDMVAVEIKTVVILLLWLGSAYKLYLIVSRLSYLENFLHICAWCRKIQQQDVWLSLEEHFQKRTGGAVSHGICPECAERLQQEAVSARRRAASTG